MKELQKLFARIVQRVNINLRELKFDVSPFADSLIPPDQMNKFYAFYGTTTDHPLDLHFEHSALAGSYFLGKCRVKNSLLYKSDIRGDELQRKNDVLTYSNFTITLTKDEIIDIEDSALVKTLVHNYSHDPETLEKFFIRNTLAMDYANIHGAPSDGCFLGPFATVDLTTMRDCAIGAYSYIQAGEINSNVFLNFLRDYNGDQLITPDDIVVEYLAGFSQPELDPLRAAAAHQDIAGAFVRVRWTVAEEDRHQVDRAAIERLLEGAAETKLEGRILPVVRTRAAGISQLANLADKVRVWAQVTEARAEPLLECLQALASQEPDAIAERVLRGQEVPECEAGVDAAVTLSPPMADLESALSF